MATKPVLKCKRHVGNEQPRIDVPVAQGSDDGFRHKRQMEARKFERAVVRRQAQRVPPAAPSTPQKKAVPFPAVRGSSPPGSYAGAPTAAHGPPDAVKAPRAGPA